MLIKVSRPFSNDSFSSGGRVFHMLGPDTFIDCWVDDFVTRRMKKLFLLACLVIVAAASINAA